LGPPRLVCRGQEVPGKLAACRLGLVGRLTLRRLGEYAGDASRSSPPAARPALLPAVLQAGRVRDGGNPDRDDYADRRQAGRERGAGSELHRLRSLLRRRIRTFTST